MRHHTELSSKERFYILTRDHFTCQYCGQSAPDVTLHVDHLQPVALGGTNHPSNLLAACEACNLSKSDNPLPETLLQYHRNEIHKREAAMTEHERRLAQQSSRKPAHSDRLLDRPTALLRTHKDRIVEPFKGRSLHPNKRHAIRFTVHEDDAVMADYCRYSPTDQSWQEQPVQLDNERGYRPTVWRPLHDADLNALHEACSFECVTQYDEFNYRIQLYRDNRHVHFLTLTNTTELTQAHYCFWTPVKELEMAITIDTPVAEQTMNEELFWADDYIDDDQ